MTPLWMRLPRCPCSPHTLSARPLVINSSSTIRLRFFRIAVTTRKSVATAR
ncbi:hypothetical protein ACP0HM_14815 [Escherichia coli]